MQKSTKPINVDQHRCRQKIPNSKCITRKHLKHIQKIEKKPNQDEIRAREYRQQE